jgi:hypothetical protein
MVLVMMMNKIGYDKCKTALNFGQQFVSYTVGDKLMQTSKQASHIIGHTHIQWLCGIEAKWFESSFCSIFVYAHG